MQRDWQIDLCWQDCREDEPLKESEVLAICGRVFASVELAQLPKSVCELSVLFTDDRQIAELNQQYRGKSGPTDVLSFSQLEGEGGELSFLQSLGDVVISLERAKAQALERGITWREEVVRLLVHGILHLLGFEHEAVSEEEAEKMYELQEKILGDVLSPYLSSP